MESSLFLQVPPNLETFEDQSLKEVFRLKLLSMSQEIRYRVEIDEGGFPNFDGLRVDDDGLLKALFQNMSRLPSRDRSLTKGILTTECDGERAHVVAFSDPLVAQGVTLDLKAPAPKVTWHFLGGLNFDLPLKLKNNTAAESEIRQDPWGRLHAYVGPARIPAVLSRKAQAAFLNGLNFPPNFAFPDWRSSGEDLSQGRFWDEVYASGQDAWEMQKPSPVLVEQWKKTHELISSGASVLVPGAGRGHDAIFLAENNLKVTALDFSKEAQNEFAKKYPASSVRYLSDDIFRHLEQNPQVYDAIFEHTIYCAIDPARREEYIDKVKMALKPQGLWFGIHFMHTNEGGPPFGNTQWELKQMTQDGFDYKEWEISKFSPTGRLAQELWSVMRKK